MAGNRSGLYTLHMQPPLLLTMRQRYQPCPFVSALYALNVVPSLDQTPQASQSCWIRCRVMRGRNTKEAMHWTMSWFVL